MSNPAYTADGCFPNLWGNGQDPFIGRVPHQCPVCDGTGVMPPRVLKARGGIPQYYISLNKPACAGCNGTGVVR